jgi:hypothetical protein
LWSVSTIDRIKSTVKKEFKGELCVYCGESLATTNDHVISREFFLVKNRANLPQVPACGRCNNEKSALEHYLTVVLAFGGMAFARHRKPEDDGPEAFGKERQAGSRTDCGPCEERGRQHSA